VFVARALRIAYPGAVYHVMGRGNQGQDIVGDDRKKPLEFTRISLLLRWEAPSQLMG
jgi:hypothetical protein